MFYQKKEEGTGAFMRTCALAHMHVNKISTKPNIKHKKNEKSGTSSLFLKFLRLHVLRLHAQRNHSLTDLIVRYVTVVGIFTSIVTVSNFTIDASFNRSGGSNTCI